MQDGEPFTVAAFNEENPTHSLMQRLHTGAFGRGLVQPNHLRAIPKVSTLLRDLIRHTRLEWEEVADKEAPPFCHHFLVSYAFQRHDSMPYDVRAMSCGPLQLKTFSDAHPDPPCWCTKRHKPTTRSSIPGRILSFSFFSVTAGNVRISPEFASAKWALADVVDRVDFFIPVAKWGIVINRDGNRLSEHNSRFEDFGAYGAWLRSGDMTDYMLLDCRTSVPRKGHPIMTSGFWSKYFR